MLVRDNEMLVELIARADQCPLGPTILAVGQDALERAEPALVLTIDDIHEMAEERIIIRTTVSAVRDDEPHRRLIAREMRDTGIAVMRHRSTRRDGSLLGYERFRDVRLRCARRNIHPLHLRRGRQLIFLELADELLGGSGLGLLGFIGHR